MDRIFTIHGEKCVSCNQPCGKTDTNNSDWTSQLRKLGVKIEYEEELVSDNYFTVICIKSRLPNNTPRVCLVYEENPVIDADTNEIISRTTPPDKG